MLKRALLSFVLALLPLRVWAYGVDGHETIGLLAEQILAEKYPAAHAKVSAVLGKMENRQVTVQVASIWADCLRSYEPGSDGKIRYAPSGPESPDCAVYHHQSADEAFSLAYVQDHYATCEYNQQNKGCHKSFHFADIPIQSASYQNASVGKNNHDIVRALQACVKILQGKRVAEPFTHIDKRAALFLLIHLVGDLHQPLHVGAIYLKQNGKPDPAPRYPALETEATAGGNFIAVGSSNNLHRMWDETDYRRRPKALAVLRETALENLADQSVLKSAGEVNDALIESWANETLQLAGEAYAGLRFSGDGNQKWALSYIGGKKGKIAYFDKKATLHNQEVALASARLAWLLQELFK